MSWARLSLRALSLDKESRREDSSALSLVIDSSSSTRPTSACRVRTRVARGGQTGEMEREGERREKMCKDMERQGKIRRKAERWGEAGGWGETRAMERQDP